MPPTNFPLQVIRNTCLDDAFPVIFKIGYSHLPVETARNSVVRSDRSRTLAPLRNDDNHDRSCAQNDSLDL